jgi:hypothetical protein
MAANVVRVNGDYKIQTSQGGNITLDTGSSSGIVSVIGDLVVSGTTTRLNTVELNIEDNTIVLNKGHGGVTGVVQRTSGIVIDRSNDAEFGNASIIWNEDESWDDPVSATLRTGAFVFSTATGGLNGIKTNSIDTKGSQLYINTGSTTISVHGTNNYETHVSDDDDIPNKKYVDDTLAYAIEQVGGAIRDFPPNPNLPGFLLNNGIGGLSWYTPSKADFQLGNVTNESKATMFTDAKLTGTPTAPTATSITNTTQIATTEFVQSQVTTLLDSVPDAGKTLGKLYTLIGNLGTDFAAKAPLASPTFTGTVSGVTSTHVGLGNVTNESKTTMFTDPIFTGTVSGVTATHVGLGNVTNESKATMFTTPTFTGHPTLEGVTATGATGTGKLVFDGSPTLVTPTLGVATATSINKVTITTPSTGATLNISDGKTLSSTNTLTFSGTDSSTITLGAGGTVVYTSNKLSVFAATTSAELAGVISDETGSGLLVFATSPTFTTSIDSSATFSAWASAVTLTIGNTSAASTTNISTAAITTGTKTINIGTGGTSAAVTNINIGSSTGTNTIIYGFNAPTPLFTTSVGTSNASFDVFNTIATTINAFGDATALTIGNASTGSNITINNPTVTLAYATSLNLNGASPSISTSNVGTVSVFNTNALTGNLFGSATTINVGGVNSTSTINIAGGALTPGRTRNVYIGQTTLTAGTNISPGVTNIRIGTGSFGTTSIQSNAVGLGTTSGSLTSYTTFSASGTSIAAAASYTVGTSSTTTNGYGSMASFTIVKTGSGTTYSTGITGNLTISNSNSNPGFAIGDTITILGTALGGVSPGNDLTLTILSGLSPSTTTIQGNANVTGTVSMSSSFIRNKIINGDMRIDQRYNGNATANTINNYVVDRWLVTQSTTGKLIAQRNGGANATSGISATYYQGGTVGASTLVVTGSPNIFQGQSITGTGIPANSIIATSSVLLPSGNTSIALANASTGANANFTTQAAGTYYFSPLPPPGFTHHLSITSQSAYTMAVQDLYLISQTIEGYNISDLDFGRSTAKPITVSFWAYSTNTGIYSWRLVGGTNYFSYVSTFTISAANTWQYFSFVVPGCNLLGSWWTDSSAGLIFQITLASESTTQGQGYATNKLNQWQSGNYAVANTQTGNIVGTSGAVFNLTGVQIEVGTVATPFERRPYGQELQLCQRYYEYGRQPLLYMNNLSSVVDNPTVYGSGTFRVTKRTTPAMTQAGFNYYSGGTAVAFTPGTIAALGVDGYYFTGSGFSSWSGWPGGGNWYANSEF